MNHRFGALLCQFVIREVQYLDIAVAHTFTKVNEAFVRNFVA